MPIDKKYQNKIIKHFNDSFKTETHVGSQNYRYGSLGGLMTIIDEPLVKQQIIELAKLCEDVSLNTTLKASGGKIIIEFW